MPSPTNTTVDMQSRSDLVRLTAILMFVEETHDNDIVRGWASKLLTQMQSDVQLEDDEVARLSTDIERIATDAVDSADQLADD